jgi:hypothetical protein
MKHRLLLTLTGGILMMGLPAFAVDHNNIDAGRPLDFDDADAIGQGEKTIEFGASISKPKDGKTAIGASAEYLYGFAPNSHFSLDFHPEYAANESGKRRFDAGDVGIGIFHNFNREFGNTPALSARIDAKLPTGRGSSGIDFRLRGIASKQFQQYSRLHLNVDLNVNNGAESNERKLVPAVVLGYSAPIGYPTNFTRTLVGQIGYRQNDSKGESGILNVGVGLRQQIGIRSVFDIGLKSDVDGGNGREKLALIAGYSRQF